jgi:hypothetical protein
MWVFAVAAVGGAMACAPMSVSPTAKAAQVAHRQCDPSASRDEVRVINATTVLDAEPVYSHVLSGNNNSENRLNGAKLIVRPPDGVSAEEMTRILQCHSAQALLGQVDRAELASDPYWLPDTWLNISVTPENGNYAIRMEADTIRDNQQVLSRVNAFAQTHGLRREPSN